MSGIFPAISGGAGTPFGELSGVDLAGAPTGSPLVYDGSVWTYGVTMIHEVGGGTLTVGASGIQDGAIGGGANPPQSELNVGLDGADNASATIFVQARGLEPTTAGITLDADTATAEISAAGGIILSGPVTLGEQLTPTDRDTPSGFPIGTITTDDDNIYVFTTLGWAAAALSLLPAP